ncbi:MAG: hypothetical protein RMK51_08235 [Meiothermus sp.]|uniref:hypothetical protein n=1 Tax=Meiothermus sp. TaxID=1955249 RepID=UPI0025EBAD7E|nr:hypothetical protein [Meiothermus sp.]MCS7069409.1 hypothetical protein [Meiothermus sp.]MCX7741568.1 hypothetical protein [Meiothermus sp.]MDW8425908.1 hypothetical protein [Meiothermus sp.]
MWRILVVVLLLLAACAPRTGEPQTNTALIQGPVGFYPSQPGLDWIYLPPRASIGDPPVRLSVIGPTTFEGQPAIRFRLSGRGLERSYYRQIDASGVRLLGIEDFDRLQVARYTPAIQEYPPQASLAVGARWGGQTREVIELRPNNQATRVSDRVLEYTYTVLGKSNVTVPAGSFEVFRIGLEYRDPRNPSLRENFEVWFFPGVGEIFSSVNFSDQGGLSLIDRNFR